MAVRTCAHCDKSLAGRRIDARYCGERCRGRARRRRAAGLKAHMFRYDRRDHQAAVDAAYQRGHQDGAQAARMETLTEAIKAAAERVARREQHQGGGS